MSEASSDILVLFDVDGTLTPSRGLIAPEVEAVLLEKLKSKAVIGVVTGSDLKKIAEQMGGDDVTTKFDYVFPENGLVAYHDNKLICKESIVNYLGEEKCQAFINFCLKYMSNLVLPCKRGNFVEFRNGLINICPVGRSCSQQQREEFLALDQKEGIRKTFVESLEKEFPNLGLCFAIGGQISIDAFPDGWDKRFCLRHIEKDKFKEIHFFGDKTDEGGNDYHIFSDPRTIGHKVKNPADTVRQLFELFNL